MKSLVKWGIFLTIFGLLAYGSYLYFFATMGNLSPLSAIPGDAVYILETEEPIENWKQISKSQPWKHLQTNAYFASLTSGANALDKMIEENKAIFDFLGSRKVLASAHVTGRHSFDFLFVVDLNKVSRISALQAFIENFEGGGFRISKRKVQGKDVLEISNLKSKDKLHLAFVGNLLMGSYAANLLEKALLQIEKPQLFENEDFKEVVRQVEDRGMFRVYLNYKTLDDYLSLYMPDEDGYLKSISERLNFTGLRFDIDENGRISAVGSSTVNDSIDSYFLALLESGKGSIDIAEIAPLRTAFYMGLGFDDINSFYDRLHKTAKGNVKDYEDYMQNVEKLEKFLKFSVKEHFLGWVDNEMAFIQTQPTGMGRLNEFAVVLKAKSASKAVENLDFIGQKIRKRTPVKFKKLDYKGYQINFLSVKGFFKLILGKFFSKLEKPYYTVIKDFVVFSNHPQTLKSIIDDFEAGQTLAKSDAFNDFRDDFSTTSNVFAYVHTPVMFNNLKEFVSPQTWQDMVKNKKYILSFSQFGFQLEKDGDKFATRIILDFKDLRSVLEEENQAAQVLASHLADSGSVQLEDATLSTGEAFRQIAVDAEDLISLEAISPDDLDAKEYQEFYASGALKFEVPLKNGMKHGTYREYYENGDLRIKGSFRKDKMDGTWKTYDEKGKTVQVKKYKDGALKP